jgi:hypothetical protein
MDIRERLYVPIMNGASLSPVAAGRDNLAATQNFEISTL